MIELNTIPAYSRELVCCFTGHRAASLPWGYANSGIKYAFFKKKLLKSIEKAIKNGYLVFVSGMALGFDMMAAECVLDLKKKYPNIKLECAIPCKKQYAKWSESAIEEYKNICNAADYITLISDTFYFNGCMQKRNKYMIDKSSKVIACYNGTKGGTQQTIELAEQAGLDIDILKP